MKKAFTLIELLIVLAIVGILVAVVVSAVQTSNCKEEIMEQCLQDNKKSYECRAIAKDVCEDDVVHVYTY